MRRVCAIGSSTVPNALKTNMAKTTGWSPCGARLVDHAPFGHWQTQTPDQVRGRPFIAALRHDWLDAPWVIDGPINRELFDLYVETQLAPTLHKGDDLRRENDPPGAVDKVILFCRTAAVFCSFRALSKAWSRASMIAFASRLRLMAVARLCCTNRLTVRVPLSPDGLMVWLQ